MNLHEREPPWLSSREMPTGRLSLLEIWREKDIGATAVTWV
jgi:hypothetical protein